MAPGPWVPVIRSCLCPCRMDARGREGGPWWLQAAPKPHQSQHATPPRQVGALQDPHEAGDPEPGPGVSSANTQ